MELVSIASGRPRGCFTDTIQLGEIPGGRAAPSSAGQLAQNHWNSMVSRWSKYNGNTSFDQSQRLEPVAKQRK
jgi:hypothetical protein